MTIARHKGGALLWQLNTYPSFVCNGVVPVALIFMCVMDVVLLHVVMYAYIFTGFFCEPELSQPDSKTLKNPKHQ